MATVTLVVVAGPTVVTTLAPPVILATSSSIPGPTLLFLLGPTEILLAHPPFPLIPPLLSITGPDSLWPSLLLPFPLHLGLPLLKAMHLLLVFLVRDRHKVITLGLVLL